LCPVLEGVTGADTVAVGNLALLRSCLSVLHTVLSSVCSILTLMTALAALAGFFPLVVASGAGALSQRSLGAVIFGGLLVPTMLRLFVVPSFYVLMKQLEASWFPASAQTEVLPGEATGDAPR
jgi:hypothetical protein